MIKLPSGIDNNNLINDLRVFSWEASEILLKYSQILKDSKNKSNILSNDNLDDPVTLADLKVNEMIINRINEKYIGIDWKILKPTSFSHYEKNEVALQVPLDPEKWIDFKG